MSISPSYWKALGSAAVIQACVISFCGMVLDGGALLQLCGMAILPFWAATFLLIWRRPQQPTHFDLSFIRVGYLPVVLLTFFLAPFIWRLRGVM